MNYDSTVNKAIAMNRDNFQILGTRPNSDNIYSENVGNNEANIAKEYSHK